MYSKRKRLVLWGSSGHARVVADIVRATPEYDLVGMLDDLHPERRGEAVSGVSVLGDRSQLEALRREGVSHLIVAIGDCAARHHLSEVAIGYGFQLATAVHPSAVVASDAVIGGGTVVAAAGVVGPGAHIGRSCVVNTSASVDHDCTLADAVHIGPGAHIGGGTTIGLASWIGIGATVVDHIRVGAGAIVGAGAVITKDVPDKVVVYGVPGRIIRRVPTEPEPSS